MKKMMKGLSFGLAFLMVAGTMGGIIPGTGVNVKAVTEKTITGLGTGPIADPANGAGSWSYVYYGKYDGVNPTIYRVLDTSTSEFGGHTMLLDCTTILYSAVFDEDGVPNSGASKENEWAYSDMKRGLNGSMFLTKDGNFTSVEQAAITSSTKAAPAAGDGDGINLGFAPLNGEKLFVLDAVEATNESYGFQNDWGASGSRIKRKTGGDFGFWWMRSPNLISENASVVSNVGVMWNTSVTLTGCGVSPAFNVDLSSVIFTSLVSGTAGELSSEYKLTLKDDNMSVAVSDGADIRQKGRMVFVPYTISGSNAANVTQVSVLITDSEYADGTAKADGFTYLKLNVADGLGSSGTGTFTLPEQYSGTWGEDYHVYILAEDVNGEKETDYASVPVELLDPVIVPPVSHAVTFRVKNGCWEDGTIADQTATLMGYEGDTLKLTADMIPVAGTKPDEDYLTGSWDVIPDSDKEILADTTYTYTYAKKPLAVIAAAPTAKELIYNGEEQTLINVGEATGGMLVYSLDDKTYSAELPTAKAVGGYVVYYKVLGDFSHIDSEAGSVKVTIEPAVYTNISGEGADWTKGSDTGLSFIFKRNAEDSKTISHFAGIKTDEEVVDTKNYSYKSGSVVIELKAEFLETLSVGEHTFTAMFDDGDAVTVPFNIKAKIEAAENSNAAEEDDKENDTGEEEPKTDSIESEKKADIPAPTEPEKKADTSAPTVPEEKADTSAPTVPEEKADTSAPTVPEEKADTPAQTAPEEKADTSAQTAPEEKADTSAPADTIGKESPKTGDARSVGLLLILMGVTLSGGLLCVRKEHNF